jgi:hypothetical protein
VIARSTTGCGSPLRSRDRQDLALLLKFLAARRAAALSTRSLGAFAPAEPGFSILQGRYDAIQTGFSYASENIPGHRVKYQMESLEAAILMDPERMQSAKEANGLRSICPPVHVGSAVPSSTTFADIGPTLMWHEH